MKEYITFDALIVYTGSLAVSAAENSGSPFRKGSSSEFYNVVYGYFLEVCERFGLTAAFSTSEDIIGPGLVRSFWVYRGKRWIKINTPAFSRSIFDKFSPTKSKIKIKRDLLFSYPSIRPFNDPEMFELFFDKYKTYEELASESIPTVPIDDPSISGIRLACKKLSKLIDGSENKDDFTDECVIKDRYGAGGKRIYKFKMDDFEGIAKRVSTNKSFSYVIQPMVNFTRGFRHKNQYGPTDIRLIFLNGKIIQSYIRKACEGDFRCNEHSGGSLIYIPLEMVPDQVIDKANAISEKIDNPRSLYALDFLISNRGKVYFLEGNTGPGLDWNPEIKKNENEAKKLIREVVRKLVIMVETDPYRKHLATGSGELFRLFQDGIKLDQLSLE